MLFNRVNGKCQIYQYLGLVSFCLSLLFAVIGIWKTNSLAHFCLYVTVSIIFLSQTLLFYRDLYYTKHSTNEDINTSVFEPVLTAFRYILLWILAGFSLFLHLRSIHHQTVSDNFNWYLLGGFATTVGLIAYTIWARENYSFWKTAYASLFIPEFIESYRSRMCSTEIQISQLYEEYKHFCANRKIPRANHFDFSFEVKRKKDEWKDEWEQHRWNSLEDFFKYEIPVGVIKRDDSSNLYKKYCSYSKAADVKPLQEEDFEDYFLIEFYCDTLPDLSGTDIKERFLSATISQIRDLYKEYIQKNTAENKPYWSMEEFQNIIQKMQSNLYINDHVRSKELERFAMAPENQYDEHLKEELYESYLQHCQDHSFAAADYDDFALIIRHKVLEYREEKEREFDRAKVSIESYKTSQTTLRKQTKNDRCHQKNWEQMAYKAWVRRLESGRY